MVLIIEKSPFIARGVLGIMGTSYALGEAPGAEDTHPPVYAYMYIYIYMCVYIYIYVCVRLYTVYLVLRLDI